MANEPATAVTSSQYSQKVQSLLNFLDEQCEQRHDIELPGNGGEHAFRSRSACASLVDATNNSSTGNAENGNPATHQNEEKFKDSRICLDAQVKTCSKLHVMREKKYIWDDWREMGTGVVLLQDEHSTLAGDEVDELGNPKGSSINAQQQLQELKSLSDEIQTRATAMKIELERKNKVVKELQSIRVNRETDHVQKIKSLKQKWKKRLEVATSERDMALSKCERLKETLQNECQALEKDLSCVQDEIERLSKAEEEICDRVRKDGQRNLEKASMSWQHLEREEIKKRDQKISPKLKRDAAKAVEPKLRLMMEKNKEKITRLEREKARELDCYRLHLYKVSNQEFKKETSNIRVNERNRNTQLEAEWIAKLESSGARHEIEIERLQHEHDQRATTIKCQFNADKQKCIDEHVRMKKEAGVYELRQVEDTRVRHDSEMKVMEDKYAKKIVQRRFLLSNGFEEWTVMREAALKEEEAQKIQDDNMKLKAKIQSDVDFIEQKLREDEREKNQQINIDIARNKAAMKEKYDVDVKKLQCLLNEARKEFDMLKQREAKQSCIANELEDNLSLLKVSFREVENQVISKEKKLAAVVNDCGHRLANTKKDGQRHMIQLRHEKEALEKRLDSLIAIHPKQQEEWTEMLKSLKTDNAGEMSFAKKNVDAMIQNKNSLLEREREQLFHLQQETAQLKRQLNGARISNIVGKSAEL